MARCRFRLSAGARGAVAFALGVMIMLGVAACGASGAGGSSGTMQPPVSTPADTVSPEAIVSCLRAAGASVKLSPGAWQGQSGLPEMRAEIKGGLDQVGFDIVVFRSPDDARQYLTIMIGMTGGKRTVDGVPIEQMFKRAGPVVIQYPYRPRPATAQTIESCFGGNARFDPDLLTQLSPADACSGAAGTAMSEIAPPLAVSPWKPEHVEGGGCVVRFTTSRPAALVVSAFRKELSSHGWKLMHTSGPLLTMWRDSLAVTLERDHGQYSLYIRSLEYLE